MLCCEFLSILQLWYIITIKTKHVIYIKIYFFLGGVTMVFETLHILSGLIEKDRIALMKEYEDRLVKECTYRRGKDTFVEYIIAAEKFNLKNLLSKAIESARNFYGETIQQSERYYEISDKSRREMHKQTKI